MGRTTPTWMRSVRVRRRVGDAAVFLVVASSRLPADHTIPPWNRVTFCLNLVAAVVLLGRRRRPATVLAATVVVAWAGVALDAFGVGAAVAAAVAAYEVAARGSRRRAMACTAAAAVAVYAASLAAGMGGVQFLLMVLLGGAVGDAIRSQRAHLQAMRERVERAERTRDALARQRVAEDRLSIARDLHDVVAHQIAVINLHAGRASSALRTRPDDAEQSLATIRGASRTVLTEIGDLLSTLRDPHALDTEPPGLGLLDDVVREFTVQGLEVDVRTEGEPRELPAAVDVVALRTVQEALTNVHKHGSGRRAELVVRYLPDRLSIRAANPAPAPTGRPGPRAVTSGYGLVGMRERIESVRGTLTYGPSGPGAWLLVADLPSAVADPGEAPAASGGAR